VESGCAGLGSAVAIAIDACSNSVLTGSTQSSAFPVINGYSATLGGTRDAFLMQIHSTGGATADLTVSVDDAPDPLFTGETVTHSVQVTNNGPQHRQQRHARPPHVRRHRQGTLPGQCEASGGR
jgi:hypothetical protein